MDLTWDLSQEALKILMYLQSDKSRIFWNLTWNLRTRTFSGMWLKKTHKWTIFLAKTKINLFWGGRGGEGGGEYNRTRNYQNIWSYVEEVENQKEKENDLVYININICIFRVLLDSAEEHFWFMFLVFNIPYQKILLRVAVIYLFLYVY